jgi:BirA family biotin operon repressor/biotin-[acetyl-CoA-carboxylase] ligase
MFTGVAGDRARSQLAATRFANIEWVSETGSTNADLLVRLRDGAGEGAVLVADHQLAGRGRQGRSWTAPAGASLLVSVLLRPPAAVAGVSGMAAGVAMADAVRAVAGVAPRLKWPNDLVLPGDGTGHDRKVAGILSEADWPAGANISAGWRQPHPGERVGVVVGVGVNVHWPPALPADLEDVAVALNHVSAKVVDREDLLVAYLRCLDDVYAKLVAERSAESVLDAWRERSATLGRRVRVDLGAADIEGVARDVTGDGHLIVDTAEGAREVAVGDVVHIRAEP